MIVPLISPPQVLTPDVLKGIDDLIRADFEAFRNACFNWLLISTGVVVLGLLFELPEIWLESINAVNSLRHSPEFHIPAWVKLVVSFGWLLIVVGVAGEFVADSFVSKADGFVQKFDEILLADAQKKTGTASERAAKAFERATQTEREASQENERAAQALAAAELARKDAEGLELQISQAKERAAAAEQHAAEANEKTEEEHTARLKLEAQLAPRRVSSEQEAMMKARLRGFKKYQITLFAIAGNPETSDFAADLESVFKAAGFTVENTPGMLFGGTARGLFASVGTNRVEDAKLLAQALFDAGLITTPLPAEVNNATDAADKLLLRIGPK
jgi:hypothetical protein